ncbi:MAG TPA: hypothetical protein EYP57_05830 [Thermodesulfobacteriaceae bacterium]|nr:hypothetical protein [Thermodesulfobacteriaceae bacterium]
MSVSALISSSSFLSQEDFGKIIKNLSKEKVKEMCEHLRQEKDLEKYPGWLTEISREFCSRN